MLYWEPKSITMIASRSEVGNSATAGTGCSPPVSAISRYVETSMSSLVAMRWLWSFLAMATPPGTAKKVLSLYQRGAAAAIKPASRFYVAGGV